jgi:ArsR family transcriptional regulator
MNDPITFAQALADETRWRILRLVFADALCVCELADILRLPQSTVSSHLQVIRKANLLDSERCEKWVYYQVAKSYRRLLTSIFTQFPDASLIADDAARKTARLTRRNEGDCRGPKCLPKLARRRLATA